jgi:voltage-gated potassium channel
LAASKYPGSRIFPLTSISKGVHWTIVTITTVGYSIIAVPTDIVSAEMTAMQEKIKSGRTFQPSLFRS